MILDCVHMAMEDGGITKKQLNGIMNGDYRGAITGNSDHFDHYTLTGTAPSIASARVSYQYHLLGPVITVDTVFSSAFVCIHLAVQALRTGDCDMAICGGANSILYPELFITLSKARMASPTGQCQAFSDKADGYARGKGCGIFIKPLSKALFDGDKIWASFVTGFNQDAHRATPIIAPSTVMQIQLLEKIYSRQNIDPSVVQYIEAHGTGTPTGDPDEANSLGQFFSKIIQNDNNYTQIGSVKTNIAHPESAAGSAGLIEVIMMKHGKYIPLHHLQNFNPAINFEKCGRKMIQDVSDWDEPLNGQRIGCVNSFGFGGANSHAVVRQYKQEFPNITVEKQQNFEEIDCHLRSLTGWSIYDKLRDGEDVSDPCLGHLSIFTCQIVLSAVWKYWGIIPDAIVGQSVRHVATSYVSGPLSLKDAVDVIYRRSLFLSMEIGGGMMVVKNLEETPLEEMICNLTKGKVNIAV